MELHELVARESIRDIVARYNSNGDSGRLDKLIELFAADAVFEAGGQICHGHNEIRMFFENTARKFSRIAGFKYVRHFTGTLQIDILNATEARSRCYFAAIMAGGLDHWGRYIDEYSISDGRWRFSKRRVQMDGYDERSSVAAFDNL